MSKDEALKLALEALGAYMSATDSEEDVKAHSLMTEAFFKIKEALAQPEQEPVGTVKELLTKSAWEKLDLRGSTKLYTAPPKRQPLTDEETYEVTGTASVELFKLAKQWSANEIHSYQFDNEARKIIKAVLFRAIEAKSKELNT